MTEQERGIRSFVLRQGRMTQGQARALEQLWPSMGLDPDKPVDLAAAFGNDNPVVLEIGFGMGESLAEQAAQHPAINYLGVEVHRPGVGHLLMLAQQQALTNIRVFAEDSINVLQQALTPGSLDGVQVFFPDPWHKKRHHKRRLVNDAFLDLLSTRLKPGGLVHIATDWLPYAESIREVIARRDDFKEITPLARPQTKFEHRGLKLGHKVTDLACRLDQ